MERQFFLHSTVYTIFHIHRAREDVASSRVLIATIRFSCFSRDTSHVYTLLTLTNVNPFDPHFFWRSICMTVKKRCLITNKEAYTELDAMERIIYNEQICRLIILIQYVLRR